VQLLTDRQCFEGQLVRKHFFCQLIVGRRVAGIETVALHNKIEKMDTRLENLTKMMERVMERLENVPTTAEVREMINGSGRLVLLPSSTLRWSQVL